MFPIYHLNHYKSQFKILQNDIPHPWQNTDKRICGIGREPTVATKKEKSAGGGDSNCAICNMSDKGGSTKQVRSLRQLQVRMWDNEPKHKGRSKLGFDGYFGKDSKCGGSDDQERI